ncbi:facilitated trehalose transporter Tret1-like isoform X3 [Belonocnema kinseyi]|uniref:facilitated trehalose transporter Tret1-like isoform X3 n=1 Tax=Belonocnema kinseyi TaxID=2817044 RepID=UPI00143D6D49|nr:facilitated trehalose transporter Tret1-like isoform X3 [Belonocnema kinseyi]
MTLAQYWLKPLMVKVPDDELALGADGQNKKNPRSQWKQWLACISATLSMVSVGTVYGWVTTILSRPYDDIDIPIKINSEEGSWISSLTVIGSMLGSFLAAWLSDRFGRKRCLLLTSIFYITGWTVTIFAWKVEYLYVARIILGVGVGMSYSTNPMYVSEVADVKIRGALGTLIAVNVFTGSLLMVSIGPWVSYQILGTVGLIIPLIFVLVFLFFPESPYYLATKEKHQQAMKVIAFFKGIEDRDEAKKELDIVLEAISQHSEASENWRDRFRQLFLPNNRKALLIISGLILTQQLSGNFSMMQYIQDVLTKANDIGLDPYKSTIIIFAVGLLAGTVSTFTVDCCGRRPLLLFSIIGCTITLGIFATYIYLDSRFVDLSSVNLIPIIDMVFFQIVFQIGLGTLPNALIGELFPGNVKGIAAASLTVLDGILTFTVVKLYQPINDAYGQHMMYAFFAVSCSLAFFFVLAFVPETKKRTLNEIQEILSQKGFRHRKRRVSV